MPDDQCPTCHSLVKSVRRILYHPTEDALCFDSWHDQQYDLLKAISLLSPLTGQEPGLDLLAEILREMVRRVEELERKAGE